MTEVVLYSRAFQQQERLKLGASARLGPQQAHTLCPSTLALTVARTHLPSPPPSALPRLPLSWPCFLRAPLPLAVPTPVRVPPSETMLRAAQDDRSKTVAAAPPQRPPLPPVSPRARDWKLRLMRGAARTPGDGTALPF